MALRETTFVLGGGITIALGVALAAGLLWAGAGLEFFGAWLSAGLAVGFGAFFLRVGRDAVRDRREALRELERDDRETEPRRTA